MYRSSRCTPSPQRGEQAETLPYPVQESASTGQWPPRDLQLGPANSYQTLSLYLNKHSNLMQQSKKFEGQ